MDGAEEGAVWAVTGGWGEKGTECSVNAGVREGRGCNEGKEK